MLVVSLSLRRANHSSDRWGASDGESRVASTSDDGGRRMIRGEIGEISGSVHVEKGLKISFLNHIFLEDSNPTALWRDLQNMEQ